MATVGVNNLKVALVDAKTQQLVSGAEGLSVSGILEIGDESLGINQADISGLNPSQSKVYGSNKLQNVTVGKAEPTLKVTINDLEASVKEKILGHESDGKGGYVPSSDPKYHVAVLASADTFDKSGKVYWGFGNAVASISDEKLETNDNQEKRNADEVTFTALACRAFKDQAYKKYVSTDSKFDEANMLKEVFGGYTASEVTSH